MRSDSSVDPRRCLVHGLTRVEKFSGPYDPNVSNARLSWWECPQCVPPMSTPEPPAPTPSAPTWCECPHGLYLVCVGSGICQHCGRPRYGFTPVPPASAPAATADSESHAACAFPCPECDAQLDPRPAATAVTETVSLCPECGGFAFSNGEQRHSAWCSRPAATPEPHTPDSRRITLPSDADSLIASQTVSHPGEGAPSGEEAELARLLDDYAAAVYGSADDSFPTSDAEVAAERRDVEAFFARQATELAALRADVEYAAGECLVPIPEPGSDMSRVIIANRLIRRERDDAQAELAALRARVEGYRHILAAKLGYTLIPQDTTVRPQSMSYVKPSEFDDLLAHRIEEAMSRAPSTGETP